VIGQVTLVESADPRSAVAVTRQTLIAISSSLHVPIRRAVGGDVDATQGTATAAPTPEALNGAQSFAELSDPIPNSLAMLGAADRIAPARNKG
jgi:hypothetical protein